MSLVVGEAPAAACWRGVELELTHELTWSSLTSRSMTFDSRPETWFSKAVTRSRVASESVSEAAAVGDGAAVCVGAMLVMTEAWMGLGARCCTLLGMEMGMAEKGVVPEANVPVTSVPDIVVSAMLAASPVGA